MVHTDKLKVLFNDSHVNMPQSSVMAQGGPARFAQTFSKYLGKHAPEIELFSLLFSHNTKDSRVYYRETEGQHHFFELVYPRSALIDTYTKTYTKKEYIEYLAPWRKTLDEIIANACPDIIFLNGFSLTNWMLLDSAYRHEIPVCIQHAGIWKKELLISQEHFSPSIRKIFASFEKEIVKKATYQIFLNEFSRKIFFDAHGIELTKQLLEQTTIVPLPIEHIKKHPMKIVAGQNVTVGTVARWDSIKNHSAIARLMNYADSVKNKKIIMNVVTKWPANLISSFKDTYKSLVNIIKPMSPELLRKFYGKQNVIILPSYFDVSPTVVMEAILMGRPVIISDQVGWVSDYERYKLQDLIISPRSSGKVIAETINNLFTHSKLYLPRFQILQEKIIKDHNPETVFSKYYQIFKMIKNNSYVNIK